MEPKLHRQLRQKYDDAEKQYLEKFGEDSLDRVFFWEPDVYFDEWKKVLSDATLELNKAINSGVAIDPDPENAIY
ncbi:hypothetical protein VKP55_05590 [Streptococcus pyogenes]|uniref:hypothetical protein n=1 Tax=Streptococcus pyogenes TaxID=1314 RepID=UPI002B36E1EE|nr:hypothetical protein [Streptococcus pyogenes]WSE62610.1 hypothetical protein VKP55_05590 [Streptococcus pyogenes]WSE68710.1 hypothetical protein VKP53_03430 [Streptococcus pyogenes]HER4532735.1 hypothetical protein [Streptococcus pyogenes NGAS751]HER4712597.1 hypothetical protein [Streptococcus pyogenes NGAS334]